MLRGVAGYGNDDQRCSRGFGSHAIRLRNGIGLQADTPTATPPDGKRRDLLSEYFSNAVLISGNAQFNPDTRNLSHKQGKTSKARLGNLIAGVLFWTNAKTRHGEYDLYGTAAQRLQCHFVRRSY
ncbi:MAG: hypothetical protein A3I66_05690 [Burkholderiales bacterium RIFCSPLOWO2_02_FULL_57_36]|nr:MAG: hypothetical protein A3I66_05690 [Burkholderiales bacterium RIFCSPLOWO2_02_FULL_57_36]